MAGWQDDPVAPDQSVSPPSWQGDPLQVPIDFSKHISEIRARIERLPEADREEALRQWADYYVAQERSQQGVLGTAGDVLRATARGTVVGPWQDQLLALGSSGIHRLTGGRAGASYAESVAYQRAADRAFDEEHPYLSTTLQIGGALAGGGVAYRLARMLGLPSLMGTTLPRAVGIGAGVGALQAANYAAGNAEGDIWARARAALEAAPTGAVIGALAPTVLTGGPLLPRIATAGAIGAGTGYVTGGDTDAALVGAIAGGALPPAGRLIGAAAREAIALASPFLARMRADIAGIPRRIGISASADGSVPQATPGARAAAEQTLADAAVRANLTGADLRGAIGEEFGRFNSNSVAQDARMIADLGEPLQRLSGSIFRQNPEAAKTIDAILRARATGLPSDRAELQRAVEAAGLTTRPSMVLAGKADKPAGQLERLRDAFRRSMSIEDEVYHGHLGTGRQTEEAFLANMSKEADDLFGQAYRAGENADIAGALQPVFATWEQRLSSKEAEPVQGIIRRIMQVLQRSGSLEQFDRNKRYLLDSRIDNLINSPAVGRNPETVRVLTQFKNDVLAAVDAIPGAGPLYAQARDIYSSGGDILRALRAGRQAFGEQSEVGTEHFNGLQTKGEQKAFRLGMLDSFTDRAAPMRYGADRLALFDNPRIRQILGVVIPRTKDSGGVFANRPERFERYLNAEGRIVQTRAEITGNSKTAQRIADDQAYSALHTISEVFQSGGFTGAATELAKRAVQKLFGAREDVAAEMARMLFTANPQQRGQNLEAIIRRMGADRATQLANYLQRYQTFITGAAARTATSGGPSL